MSRDEIKQIAVDGAKILRDRPPRSPIPTGSSNISPETFSTAELDFSVEVCEAVMDVLQPTPDKPIILNLPATVECATPNVYADQIEWFGRNIPNRDSVVISLHTHNDRGTGVAAAELGLMAGADRVEGCLLGNGERTGNCDLVTVALNMYTQGIDPELDFSDIDEIINTVDLLHQPARPPAPRLMPASWSSPRFRAVASGRDQEGLRRAASAQNDEFWEVPYLPIDPADLGRSYEAVIRVNSQSRQGRRRLGARAGQGAASCPSGCRPISAATSRRWPTRPAASSTPTTSGGCSSATYLPRRLGSLRAAGL